MCTNSSKVCAGVVSLRVAWRWWMQRTAKLDKVTVPYVAAMQRQQKPWAYSWGAAPPQQRQLHPSVCDPSASQREHANFVTSSSPGVCRTWYTSGFGGGVVPHNPSYKAGGVESGVSKRFGAWRIYDCGSTADYYQPKKRPPPNAPKNCCVRVPAVAGRSMLRRIALRRGGLRDNAMFVASADTRLATANCVTFRG